MLQAKEIIEAALKLEPAERARIAHELLDSIDEPAGDEPAGVELTAAWEQEIQRRLRDMEAGRVEMIPAEKVFSELEADIRARRASK